MTRFLVRMGISLALCWLGLAMAFYSLERMSLINLATTLGQDDGEAPMTVRVALFIGLALVNLTTFFALWRWSRFLRANPRTRQAPVWLLVGVLVLGGAAMTWALATHTGWIRAQAIVPLSVNWGYIAFQVVAASLVLVPLVLVGARWSPGYKPRDPELDAPAPVEPSR